MTIMICGSVTFAKDIFKAKKNLEDLGYEVNVPPDIESHVMNPKLIDDLESRLLYLMRN